MEKMVHEVENLIMKQVVQQQLITSVPTVVVEEVEAVLSSFLVEQSSMKELFVQMVEMAEMVELVDKVV
jgi:hypothetical protein